MTLYIRIIIFFCLSLFSTMAMAEVRFNPITGMWEGNICSNQFGWSWHPWQPIGSICTIRLPTGAITQGIIINR